MSISDIKSKTEQRLKELDAEREQLLKVLEVLGAAPNTVAPQAKIADMLRKVLKPDQPLQLKDIYDLLVQEGYAFRGANPKMSVYSALARHPELFEHVGDKWKTKSVSHSGTKSENNN